MESKNICEERGGWGGGTQNNPGFQMLAVFKQFKRLIACFRPGSHTLPRQNAEHLQQLIDYLCQKDPKELIDFMDLCWKHG